MPAGQLTVADLFTELGGVVADAGVKLAGTLAQTANAVTVQAPAKPLASSCPAIEVKSTVPLESRTRLVR